jgi:parallel beta-helix repeat protein
VLSDAGPDIDRHRFVPRRAAGRSKNAAVESERWPSMIALGDFYPHLPVERPLEPGETMNRNWTPKLSLALGILLALVAAPATLLGPWTPLSAQAQDGAVYQTHPPIKITHNNDFRLPSSGVTAGHGTTSDPYIIEGWQFTANASGDTTAPAVWISGTNAFFVIKKCRFDGAGIGIQLDDMSNARITENTFSSNHIGLQVTKVAKLEFFKNTVSGSTDSGLVLIETGDPRVYDNSFSGNAGTDLKLNTTQAGKIEHNTFESNGVAIDYSQGAGLKVNNNELNGVGATIGARFDGLDSGEITSNKIHGFTQYGSSVERSIRVTIKDNEFTNNGQTGAGAGLHVWQSSSMKLIGNKANDNAGRGVYLRETSQSWLQDGQANGNGADGIEMRWASYDGVKNMEAKRNQRAGIDLNESSNNLIDSNQVVENKVKDNGSLIVGGNTNKVTHNEVAHNAGYGILITQWMSGNKIVANKAHDNARDDIYSDAEPNSNIISDEEIADSAAGGAKSGHFVVPGPPLALVLMALACLAVVARRRR